MHALAQNNIRKIDGLNLKTITITNTNGKPMNQWSKINKPKNIPLEWFQFEY